jgi:dihydroorotate dehydrogenase electron transfer subunit
LCDGTLLTRTRVAHDIFVLEFAVDTKADRLAPSPGQFYQVKCGGGREHVLRRPFSVHDSESSAGELKLKFIIEVVGWGTDRLCSLAPGERVSMLGPLGHGFDVDGIGRALLVAGGIGLAPLFFLARQMESAGCSYDMLVGFKSGEEYYEPLNGLAGSVNVYTEDGAIGTCGMVCDGVGSHLARGCDAVYTCGPEPMMSEVARICEGEGIPCQVSLDSRMACGIGACRGCIKEGASGRNLCVCLEGPVFDSRAVVWRSKSTEGR